MIRPRFGLLRRSCALGAAALGIAALHASSAFALEAAPSWGIEISQHNAYATECSPAALAEVAAFTYKAGETLREPAEPCGVDPFIALLEPEAANEGAIGFQRASGSNIYQIEVFDKGPQALAEGAEVTVQDTLPEGMELAASSKPAQGANWNCAVLPITNAEGVEVPRIARCTHTQPSKLQPLAPGMNCGKEPSSCWTLALNVQVAANAEPILADHAEVKSSGGGQEGAAASTEVQSKTHPPVPFGIYCMRLSALSTVPSAPSAASECGPGHGIEAQVPAGEAEMKAGGHPVALAAELIFNFTAGSLNPNALVSTLGSGAVAFAVGPKEVQVKLPPGMTGNPQNVGGNGASCPLQLFYKSKVREACPGYEPDTVVGFVEVTYTRGRIIAGRPDLRGGGALALVYNLTPPPAHPAAFGFKLNRYETPIVLFPKVTTAAPSEGSYTLSGGTEAAGPLRGAIFTFCSYGARILREGGNEEPELVSCNPPEANAKPFLTNSSQCVQAPATILSSTSYPPYPGGIEAQAKMQSALNGPSAAPQSIGQELNSLSGASAAERLSECHSLSFAPQLEVSPPSTSEGGTLKPDSPSAMNIAIKVPNTNPQCHSETIGSETKVICPPSAPQLKNLTMNLPEGMSVSPADAEGLEACSEAQFQAGTTSEAHCPTASKVGSVEVFTPLLARQANGAAPLQGALYVGQPPCEPCSQQDAEAGRLFRLDLELKDPTAGIDIKLAGSAKEKLLPPGPAGEERAQLQTSFEDQPQMPFEELIVHMKGGPRAPLANPQAPEACAERAKSTAEMIPWSVLPGEATRSEWLPKSEYALQCPSSFPFAPALSAGSEYPQAGANTNFTMTLSRSDEEQELSGLILHTPPGLTGRIASVPVLCGEAQAQSATCPAESALGNASVLVGAGASPYYQQGGSVYLTGPYTMHAGPYAGQSAPFGLAIELPTKAGPFTLAGNTGKGIQDTRAGIFIDPRTTAITVASEPLPQIVDGIPLRLRAVHVQINRPSFYINPTNCRPQQISAALSSISGAESTSADRFRASHCAALAFAPVFKASTLAKTSRLQGASLNIKITQAAGEANLSRVQVQLPEALPARLSTLQKACTEAQFKANPEGCPKESFVGSATANTPLLPVPLTGPAILVSHGGAEFPDIEFLLSGDNVHIDVVGNNQVKHDIIYTRFEAIPDQPISSFETNLPEGPHSIFAANGNLCKEALYMPTRVEGQNERRLEVRTKIQVTGCAKPKPKAKAKAKRARLLKAALKSCRRSHRHRPKRRRACEAKVHHRFGRERRRHSRRIQRSGHAAAATAGSSSTSAASGLKAQAGTGQAPAQPNPSAKAQLATVSCNQENAELHEAEEAVRAKTSNYDPQTGASYSQSLPECRAYELASPQESQGQNIANSATTGLIAGSEGSAVGYSSEGAFSEPNGFYFNGEAKNTYIARRTSGPTGPQWASESALPPAGLIDGPDITLPLESDPLASLAKAPRIACGAVPSGGYGCAVRSSSGSWHSTQVFKSVNGSQAVNEFNVGKADRGQAANLQRAFIEPLVPLLAQDNIREGGLYEVGGLGEGQSPALRLVNIGPEGTELGYRPIGAEKITELGPPLLGDSAFGTVAGTGVGAVSETGEKVFFTADQPISEQNALYARIPCSNAPGGSPRCEYLMHEGHEVPGSGRQSVWVSAPQCEGNSECEAQAEKPVIYQGASASGERVYFSSAQPLTPTALAGEGLYEYNFNRAAGKRLRWISQLEGLIEAAPSGRYVYFVSPLNELSVLEAPSASEPEAPRTVHPIAQLSSKDKAFWGKGCPDAAEAACGGYRRAQTTPDGRYLIFASYAQLAGDNNPAAQAVYRYDAKLQKLTWISRPVAPARGAEGKGATIEAREGAEGGTASVYGDMFRQISSDGSTVLFSSEERLSTADTSGAPQVYEWHCAAECANPEAEGSLALISPGNGEGFLPSLSESGQDIFFLSTAKLTPQDQSGLMVIYDARLDGGVPSQAPPPSCNGEGCQGPLGPLPDFGQAASALG